MQHKISKTGWRIVILFFLPILFLSTCKNSPPKDLSKLEWLIGKWEVNNGSSYETWIKLDEKNFFGKSYKINEEKDTSVMETMELIVSEKEILFIPSVKTSTGSFESTTFKMTPSSDQVFVFENPKHDFPKKITYFFIDKMSAKARIEDKKRKIDFEFKRLD